MGCSLLLGLDTLTVVFCFMDLGFVTGLIVGLLHAFALVVVVVLTAGTLGCWFGFDLVCIVLLLLLYLLPWCGWLFVVVVLRFIWGLG